MGSDWQEMSFGELFSVKHGFAFKGEYFTDKPTRHLLTTPGNFAIGGGFRNAKPKCYDGPIPEDYILKTGDVVVTMTDLSKASDTLGHAALIPEDENIWLHNQRVGLLEFYDPEEVNSQFICYLLRSNDYRSWIIGSATGTTVKHTSPSRIAEFSCPLPPLPEQKAIAHILGSLDDRITLNRKMNATLEAMAQALFKSWFVDYDPVIDNALRAGNPIPDELAPRAEIRRQAIANGTANEVSAQDFPSAFQETEDLGWIPEGWDESKFEILAKPKKGKNITKKTIIKGDVPVVAGGLKPAYFHNSPNVNGPVVTVSASGANAGFVNLYHQNIWASDCSYISPRETGFIYSTFLFLKSRQDRITHMQQGAAQPHVYPKDLLRLRLANPTTILWKEMEKMIKPSFLRIFKNQKENQTLSKLRDTLLPKLISGELRISEAEQLTEKK